MRQENEEFTDFQRWDKAGFEVSEVKLLGIEPTPLAPPVHELFDQPYMTPYSVRSPSISGKSPPLLAMEFRKNFRRVSQHESRVSLVLH